MSSITFDQIHGPIERVVYIGLGWLVARGFITSAEVANYATFLLAVLAAFYGWWQNRPQAIAVSAANAGMVVVTTPAIAAATPEQPNIVSQASVKVVPK